jgi:hypothetical protein
MPIAIFYHATVQGGDVQVNYDYHQLPSGALTPIAGVSAPAPTLDLAALHGRLAEEAGTRRWSMSPLPRSPRWRIRRAGYKDMVADKPHRGPDSRPGHCLLAYPQALSPVASCKSLLFFASSCFYSALGVLISPLPAGLRYFSFSSGILTLVNCSRKKLSIGSKDASISYRKMSLHEAVKSIKTW